VASAFTLSRLTSDADSKRLIAGQAKRHHAITGRNLERIPARTVRQRTLLRTFDLDLDTGQRSPGRILAHGPADDTLRRRSRGDAECADAGNER
jgi:hypothetical protein